MHTELNQDMPGQQNPLPSGESSEQTFSQPEIPLLQEQSNQLELLVHVASYSEQLLIISGPDGSGKSTLVHALAAQREIPEESIVLTADIMMGLPVILNAIATSWDMPPLSGKLEDDHEAVRQQGQRRQANGKSTLVIIDDADQLDENTLGGIEQLSLLMPQALGFALFGLPVFAQYLSQSSVQAPSHHMTLEPLTEDDAQLLVENVFGVGAISYEQWQFAYHNTSGHLSSFLHELEDLLLADADQHASKQSASSNLNGERRFPVTHLVAVSAIATLLILSFLYNSTSDNTGEVTGQSELTAISKARTPDPALEAGEDAEALAELAETESQVISPPELTIIEDASSQDNQQQKPAESESPDFNYSEVDEAPRPSKPKKIVPATLANTEQPTLHSQPSTVRPEAVSLSTDEQQLIALTRGAFIQLLGSHSEQSARRFLQSWQSKLPKTLYLYQTRHKGKDWFVVILGVYPDRAMAKQALKVLPGALRRQSPWIKQVQQVQADIKRSR